MHTNGRCEIFRVEGYDPTGENAMECNRSAVYCSVCELFICRECHREAYGCDLHQEKKSPARAEADTPNHQRRQHN